MEKPAAIGFAIAALVGIGSLFFSRSARADEITLDDIEKGGNVLNTPSTSPKGFRNNNPFNIKDFGIPWRGYVGNDADPKGPFVIFDNPINGIRAGMINIRTKFKRDGANTVGKLIPILSPQFENPTYAFIDFVARELGVTPTQPLDFDRDIIPLSKAIIRFENGVDNLYTDKEYRKAYEATL